MIILLLVVHILIAIALVGVILLQKSEGGALGIGGGGMSGFMTGRSTANLLTRATAILAAAFMATSILLVVLHNRERAPRSIIDQGAPASPASQSPIPISPGPATPPSPAPAPPTPAAPPAPAQSAPVPAAPAAPAEPQSPSPPLAR
jgi:preprotein translocase subunit SecG